MKHRKSNNSVVQYLPGAGLEMFFMRFQAIKIHLWLYYFMIISCVTGHLKEKEKSYSPGIGFS
ncbi:MAG: hypothetical protein ACFCUM_18140 [Bacteroidales bacterium]